MIGDSWQLRKYSLLGHWAAHSAEPPGPWQNGRKKGRGEEKRWGWRGVGWVEQELKSGGAGQEPTGEQ